MKKFLFIVISLLSTNINAQKKVLDHNDFDIWNRIQNSVIDSKGDYIMYSIQTGEKDSHLKIKDTNSNLIFEHERSERGRFTFNSEFAVFTIKAWKDSIKEMKREKVKKDKMPKDSIGIYNMSNGSLDKIANIKSFKLPEKWSGYIGYTYESVSKKDTTKKKLS